MLSKGKALYLKYRPKQLDDLVGQKQIVATLQKASELSSFAHAYLMSGNHGCGKTSSARIIANLMTCEDVKDGKTCGKCRSCQTVPIGASTDVIELDGATKRSIDDIKKLFNDGFGAGKRINKIPLVRGLQFGYMIIPIIAANNVGESLQKYVTDMPSKHWALFEFPVVIDLAGNQVHYFKKTPAWGAFFFSDMRNVVETYIENAME